MLTDLQTIGYRISCGDSVFSKRILLTTLVNGDAEVRASILKAVNKEDFGQSSFGLIFQGITESFLINGQVDSAYLYQKIERYVQTEVVASVLEFIDRVLAKPIPTQKMLAKAISCLQSQAIDLSENSNEADEVVIVALLKGDEQTQQWILKELSPDHFEVNFNNLFEWASQLLRIDGQITRTRLYDLAQTYTINTMRPGYLAPLDHILAIDLPDVAMIKKALIWVENRK